MKTLREALEEINWRRGTGDIITISAEHGLYVTQRQYGRGVYRFRIRGNRVFARGTSRRFDKR